MSIDPTEHLQGMGVIELRRYRTEPGEAKTFARYFESYFPEAFEQLGAIIFGHFVEREQPDRFTWIRGFRDMDARKAVNTAFYGGPVWKEHRATMNDRLIDHTDVLLLQPFAPECALKVLPAVDPLREPEGAAGIGVAYILAVAPHAVNACVARARPAFDEYCAAGAREAALLVTLDAEDNFPALPFRTDGPYIVWLGIVPNEAALVTLRAAARSAAADLQSSGDLRTPPELVILAPSPRSRLRWLEDRKVVTSRAELA